MHARCKNIFNLAFFLKITKDTLLHPNKKFQNFTRTGAVNKNLPLKSQMLIKAEETQMQPNWFSNLSQTFTCIPSCLK